MSFRYDAVLFDLDETLILDEPVSRLAFFHASLELTQDEAKARALAAAVEAEVKRAWAQLPTEAIEYAVRIGHSPLEGMWATYDSRISAEAMIDAQAQRLRPLVWENALKSLGLTGSPQHLEQRWRALRARYPLYDDVDELLARLRPHTKLAMVTNGVSGLQRRKVEGSGLRDWFDAVAISGEVGIGKPEVGIFDWVARELGVAREKCLMIGDNPERDVQGGINSGMATVWVDRGHKPRTVPASLEVRSLRDVWAWATR